LKKLIFVFLAAFLAVSCVKVEYPDYAIQNTDKVQSVTETDNDIEE